MLDLTDPGIDSGGKTFLVREMIALSSMLEKGVSLWCLTGLSGITGPASSARPGNTQHLRVLAPTAPVRTPHMEVGTYAIAQRDTRATPTWLTTTAGAQVS
jgi:hypothetical protein